MPNQIKVTGNTSKRGAEVRFSRGGAAFANFSVASQNSRYDKQQQKYIDDGDPLWMNCVARFELAEQVGEQLPADGGSKRVTVTGHLRKRSYATDAGEQREVVELVADSVCVHPPRPQRDQDVAQGGQGDTWAQPPQNQGWGATPSNDEPPF